MSDLDRQMLDEALGRAVEIREELVHVALDLLDPLDLLVDAARAYRELLANGQRVEPDYEAAARAFWSVSGQVDGTWPTKWETGTEHMRVKARAIVDAAIGDKLLIDPTTEEE